jgi:hypothetical protein
LVVRRKQHQKRKKHKKQLRGSPLNVVVYRCSNALHSSYTITKVSEFQSSILNMDLKNEARVYGG